MDYLLHGFNVKDKGAGTVDRLKPILEEYAPGRIIRDIDYGWMHRPRVRLCNKAVAKTIASAVLPKSNVIAHSNGCALVYLAAKAGARWEHVTLVNPALDSNLSIPGARSVHVWYAPSDPWTRLSTYIPWSIWGRQGRTGYTGDEDHRYSNFNEDEIFKRKMYHSGVFSNRDAMELIIHKHVEGAIPA